jgi:2-dehydro-3-deoxyphosphogluconate aldolase/(4S)-4-hydroxy-2-oxoglutarate aldolase
MNRQFISTEIQKRKAVAVVRLPSADMVMHTADALQRGGVTVLELTMTIPDALRVIEKVAKLLPAEVIVGVGSVLNAETARAAVNAGAKFVVSPIFKADIIEEAHRLQVPAMPGAFTPTEILTAWESGADIVKVFPADVLGMTFFKGILAPMPFLKLMPTGGVSLTNGMEWLNSGACAVGIGSALLDKKSIEEGNWKQISVNAATLMKHLQP